MLSAPDQIGLSDTKNIAQNFTPNIVQINNFFVVIFHDKWRSISTVFGVVGVRLGQGFGGHPARDTPNR